jgi:hypothetical protein
MMQHEALFKEQVRFTFFCFLICSMKSSAFIKNIDESMFAKERKKEKNYEEKIFLRPFYSVQFGSMIKCIS